MLVLILITLALFFTAMLLPLDGYWRLFAFAAPYLLIGFPVLKRAATSLVGGQMLDENFLMAVASLGAFVLGEYPEGVAVMLFSQIGALFESYAVGKSRDSVSQLMSLCPEEATVLREGEWQTVFPEEVQVGESVRVLPGEKVPLDGCIIEGSSSLDTRSLTGESLPRDVSVGDAVFSGCVNLNGVLVLRVEKEAEQSTASKILALVEEATARRSQSESFVTSFARWYTPFVLGIALLVAILPPVFGGDWSQWIYRGLEFLVVSCPCALVISVPLAYFGGIGGASRKGILVKGSDCLEQLAKVDAVVFDKTGTLTEGVFEVSSVQGDDPDRILEIAALCEQFSNHPIARSIRQGFGKEVAEDRVTEVCEVPGCGISAKVDGVLYFVGNQGWMKKKGFQPVSADIPGTQIYVADETRLLGSILISDKIKKNASQTVSDLKKAGISRVAMLTGDEESVASLVGKQVGISHVKANLLPQDKVTALEEIRSAGGPAAFVGDGMNDAPVLAVADVGIAMGGLGSDAAIEAADVVLMQDDLSCLSNAVFLARKTHRIVLENIIFSIAVKLVVMVLCACGFATMWHAVFADVGVSVIAILNAMRTLSKK